MTQTITINSTDEELMERFESERRMANGEVIGADDQTPAEAVESEGWTLIRAIHSGTNIPGTPVFAKGPDDRLWVVNDLDGPWAIQVSE